MHKRLNGEDYTLFKRMVELELFILDIIYKN